MKQRYPIKALLFDLDGTLADTIGDITDAVNAVMHEAHLPSLEHGVVMRHVGSGLKHTLYKAIQENRADPDAMDMDHWVQVMLAKYSLRPCVATHLYPGIAQFLENSVAGGLRLGVLSNKEERLVVEIVDTLLPGIPFVSVRGASDLFPRKPDPTLAHQFAQEAGIPEHQVLYVGDSDIDYHTAGAAGMQIALVTWGYRSRAQLEAGGFEPLFDTVEELEREVHAWR